MVGEHGISAKGTFHAIGGDWTAIIRGYNKTYQPRVRQGGDARRPVAGQINRHPVRFLVIQRRENSFT